MFQQCLNFAKGLYGQKMPPQINPLHNQSEIKDVLQGDHSLKRIPRYLQLARSIHAHFINKEEKQTARYKAAEALAARKNEVIMRALQDVLGFCEMLRSVPELGARLDKRTEDITQRLFSNRSQFLMEQGEFIAVSYAVPQYHVDLRAPDHISLRGADHAYLHISFNPVKFSVVNEAAAKQSTITKYLLVKQYKIVVADVETEAGLLTLGDAFMHFQSKEGIPADPVADILTELRVMLGHDFFEGKLLPYLEAATDDASGG